MRETTGNLVVHAETAISRNRDLRMMLEHLSCAHLERRLALCATNPETGDQGCGKVVRKGREVRRASRGSKITPLAR
jgi:hypothetical protein